MIPAKPMHGLKSHSVCQGKSYCHMLASPDLTITKLTLQNKVGVKKKKTGGGKFKHQKALMGLSSWCYMTG